MRQTRPHSDAVGARFRAVPVVEPRWHGADSRYTHSDADSSMTPEPLQDRFPRVDELYPATHDDPVMEFWHRPVPPPAPPIPPMPYYRGPSDALEATFRNRPVDCDGLFGAPALAIAAPFVVDASRERRRSGGVRPAASAATTMPLFVDDATTSMIRTGTQPR